MSLYQVTDAARFAELMNISCNTLDVINVLNFDFGGSYLTLDEYVALGLLAPFSEDSNSDEEDFDCKAFEECGNYVAINLSTGEATDNLGDELGWAYTTFEGIAQDSSDLYALCLVVAVE